MKDIPLIRAALVRPPRLRSSRAPAEDARRAPARGKRSLVADRRGAVAFETLIVYAFMLFSLFLQLADLLTFGVQFGSAWGALRIFGQYVQYNPPPDPTNTSNWISGLRTTIGTYTIQNIQVLCGDSSKISVFTPTNISDPTKSYSFMTSFTVHLATPFLEAQACNNAATCSFTLKYSERFQ